MPVLIDDRRIRIGGGSPTQMDEEELNALVTAMGKRLQVEYIEGTIPYLREWEPELWTKLEALDREHSIEALLQYERLFFEGIHRYLSFLEGRRKAA